MTTPCNALVSPRLAADLCQVPTTFVVDMIEAGLVEPVKHRGKAFVSLADVERELAELAVAREQTRQDRPITGKAPNRRQADRGPP